LGGTQSARRWIAASPWGGAGEELEHVLHLRHNLERHLHARPAREICQLAAVVEQRLGGRIAEDQLIGPVKAVDLFRWLQIERTRNGKEHDLPLVR